MRPYLVEGVGEDFWPDTFDRSSVDRWITVSDRDAFRMTRRVAREEGLLIGGSCGLAMHAAIEVARELPPDKTVLVILPDSGRPYLSKIFDDALDDRERDDGAHRRRADRRRAAARQGPRGAGAAGDGLASRPPTRSAPAVDLFQRYGISQLPVVAPDARGRRALDLSAIVGSVHERDILERVFRDADATREPVSAVMGAPLGVIARRRRASRRCTATCRSAPPSSSPTAPCPSAC